jgi:hypothetical protein
MRRNIGIGMLLAAPVLILATAVPVRAGTLSVINPDQNVTAGSIANISFFVSDSAPQTDQLGTFQVQLQLIPIIANGVLQFSEIGSQPDPFANPNYVFSTNSSDQTFPPTGFWNSVVSSVAPGGSLDLATGGDSASTGGTSFPNLNLGNGSYFLTQVKVDASSAVVGDTYRIVLVPVGGPGDPNATYFQDPNSNNIDFTSTAGTITITANVPEPTSLVMANIGGLVVLFYLGMRRTKMQPPCHLPA